MFCSSRAFVFRAQTQEIKERAGNQSTGIDFFITQERVIYLDTQVKHLAESLIPGYTGRTNELSVIYLYTQIKHLAGTHLPEYTGKTNELRVIYLDTQIKLMEERKTVQFDPSSNLFKNEKTTEYLLWGSTRVLLSFIPKAFFAVSANPQSLHSGPSYQQ